MNLNQLAILLIELDPENLLDLDEFKKNLILTQKKARGRIKNILGQVCSEVDTWAGLDPEECRLGMVRVGELLEQAMESDRKNDSGAKPKKAKNVPQGEMEPLKFTLSNEFDTDLLNEFVVESMECANMSESSILEWEKNPDNHELLNTIFRGFHTIKGTSAFLNLDCIKDLAHQSESILSRVRDGKESFTGDHADLALKTLDIIKGVLERMKSSGPGQQIDLPAGYESQLETLKNFVSDVRLAKVDDMPAKPDNHPESKEQPAQKEEEISQKHNISAIKSSGLATESTVRVKIDRLDKLLDTVGELVIAQTMVGEDQLIVNGKNHELAKKVSLAGKIVRELQDLSMILRMVPLKGTFQKMARLARDLSQKNGKKVDFIIEGDDVEIDRNMVDMMADPLVHLIRNSVDHGIETPEERRRAGKSEDGHIYLMASHAESSIMLTVWDDGRGLSRRKITDKAISRGIIDSTERMSDQEIWQLIFEPGFSTAEQVTEVSGRGVGLDVVRQAVEALRGRIEVQSSEGKGCAFTMRMPLTMAIIEGMVIKVGLQRYVLPIVNIQKAVRPSESDIHTVNQRGEMLLFQDELLPIIRLYRLFDVPDAQTELPDGLLVVIGEGQQRCALFVDDLLYQTQVVTKLLGKGINNVPGVAGGAIMSDGTVGLILDSSGIIGIARQRSNVAA
ncbi:MAG: chemotaxis protein CheA [Smithella sp.]|jgi:two-component system chemotaxis sensor kinase CheA